MKNVIKKSIILPFLLLFASNLFAQSSGGSGSPFLWVLIGIAVLVLFAVVLLVGDSLVRIEAKEAGVDTTKENYSIMPSRSQLYSPKVPGFAAGKSVKVLKRGFDILLEGEASPAYNKNKQANTFAVQPTNFIGIAPIPKVTVVVGDEVKAGDPIFYDKQRPEIKFVAPVSGEIVAINRGAKRAISEIVILADKEQRYRTYADFDLENSSREELVEYLLASGLWPMLIQRPFDELADPTATPKGIFISTFDTGPLAPDYNFVIQGQESNFQKGIDVLNKLAEGKVHLGLNAGGVDAPSTAFTAATNCQKHWFKGPHPSGNVGIQIHHTDPINMGDKVWVLGVQEVISFGALFAQKRYDAARTIVVAGSEFKDSFYLRTFLGANIGEVTAGNLSNDNVRLVSGDLLSGKAKKAENFVNFYDDQISVIKEGDYNEMFGWLLPLNARPSISKTFPNFLFKDMKFAPDTNTHGEERAFVVTGQYESVLPMDVYPQHLMKAIIVGDIERMEGLGLYELSEADVALCEFACTSKQPLQQILRQGLEEMREQM